MRSNSGEPKRHRHEAAGGQADPSGHGAGDARPAAAAPVFDSVRLGAISLDVMAVARATPAAIEARQRARLDRLREHAVAGSAHYRAALARVAPGAPLSDWPVTDRHELMARFSDWVTDPALRLDELRAFVADPGRIAEPWLGRYVIWESSGTSGEPGMFVQDAQCMAIYDALESLRRSDPRPHKRWTDPLGLAERTALVVATEGHFASHVSMERLRRVNPWMGSGVRSFSIMQPVEDLVAALDAFGPTVIATYPSVAAMLADEADRGRFRAPPREVWTGGETLSPSVRRHVERALDCAVRNSYGTSEFLAMGWECGHGRLHANTDWMILEPVDEHRRPVPPGQPSSSTLLTHLGNLVQPLIRYDLGDQVLVQAEPCPCGHPLPVIEVRGRRDEPLSVAGASGRRVTLLPMALTSVLEDEAGIFDFQLSQRDARTLELRLACEGDEGRAAAARGREALLDFAARQGARGLRIVESLGQSLPRGRSGKARRIIAGA